ncbi:glycosyltransferase family 2 protein [Empedobacter sp.]|uniref:glycosyltransferase family 2 protein n=1 Tax=Empedobacter sp. TaxID=1927715 RepID=UPI0028A8C066|nr:glycosyltransferase family 2 protein [Empedobacter sp.]
MDVSVIIVNYNTTQLVFECIETIYELTKNVIFEIIVVDNNSPDRSIERLNDVFPDVKLILNDKNSGFGAANNLGNKYATGKYLFFLNSDTLLISNAIFDFFQFMEKTPDAGVCGGNLLTKELKPTISFERFKPNIFNSIDKLFFKIFQRIIYGKNRRFLYSEIPKVIKGYIIGADFFVRKDVFEGVEGFDENFFMYYEEVDLTHRIEKLEYKSYVLSNVRIVHLEGGSQSGDIHNKLIWMTDSLRKYYKKTNQFGISLVIIIEKIDIVYINKLMLFIKNIKLFRKI